MAGKKWFYLLPPIFLPQRETKERAFLGSPFVLTWLHLSKTKSRQVPTATREGWSRLLEVCRRLRFTPHDIARHLDERGRYEVELKQEFPFAVRLFHYTSRQHTRGATWHERLELFVPLDGPVQFIMGEQEVELARGDMLVVDNLKLHHVVDFPGFDTRVVVISFLPEFVYSLGSPSHDYVFLLPFYSKLEKRPHVLRAGAAAADASNAALARLLECYFEENDRKFYQAGCKAFFLELLYCLARHCRASELLKWEFERQQQRSMLLKNLFDRISCHYADKLSVPQAAALAYMSEPQFMRTFKKVAGMTLVTYVNHVRLTAAVLLLKETALSIAEIANQVGFADQSYLDKRFKASFGQSPKEFRSSA